MKIYYDLHIHSCLSPCGDNENTPNNIVNMSKLKGLDVIAIADHNSSKNARAVAKVGEKAGILVIPALELTTSEDIHVLCLFKSFEESDEFTNYISKNMVKIENNIKIFGNQYIMNENDEIIGEEKNLLTISSGISINRINILIKEYNGIAIPAHIDRQSNGIIGVLGYYDVELGFPLVESNKKIIEYLPYITNSDAHYLENINEKVNSLEIEELSIKGVINALIKKNK
jgi:hypothetical protein